MFFIGISSKISVPYLFLNFFRDFYKNGVSFPEVFYSKHLSSVIFVIRLKCLHWVLLVLVFYFSWCMEKSG